MIIYSIIIKWTFYHGLTFPPIIWLNQNTIRQHSIGIKVFGLGKPIISIDSQLHVVLVSNLNDEANECIIQYSDKQSVHNVRSKYINLITLKFHVFLIYYTSCMNMFNWTVTLESHCQTAHTQHTAHHISTSELLYTRWLVWYIYNSIKY